MIKIYPSTTCVVMEVNGDVHILEAGEAFLIAQELITSAKQLVLSRIYSAKQRDLPDLPDSDQPF